MKRKVNIIAAIFGLLVFSNSIFAGYNTIDLNTGLNHNNLPATLYAVGQQDQFWRVLSPGTPRDSTALSVYPGWAQPQANSRWLYAGSDDAGLYTYERCFCLKGLEEAKMNLSLRADNRASVYLNSYPNIVLQTDQNQSFSPFRNPAANTISEGLVVGKNCIRVVVENDEIATGFNLSGTVAGYGAQEIADACCPTTTNLFPSE